MSALWLAARLPAADPVDGTVAATGDVNLTMVAVAAGLIGCGAYLLLERSLSRVLVGLVMMGNGVSLAFLVAGGPSGNAPIVDGENTTHVDPLPQAMVLTAIVIMLATVSFVLAMAYRSWQLTGHDDVQDDVEDALIRTMARKDIESESFRAESSDEDDAVAPASDFTVEELLEAADAAERAEERAAAARWAEEKAAQEREQGQRPDDQEGERK